jgi:hypothetical protein
MSIESTLYAALTADPGVRAFFPGSPVDVRLYALRVPDEVAVPFISYSVSDGLAYNKLGQAPDKERKEIYFLCVSDNFKEALDLAGALKNALEDDYGYMLEEQHEYFSDTQEYGVAVTWSYIA